jgi:hypothetical protein
MNYKFLSHGDMYYEKIPSMCLLLTSFHLDISLTLVCVPSTDGMRVYNFAATFYFLYLFQPLIPHAIVENPFEPLYGRLFPIVFDVKCIHVTPFWNPLLA